MINPEIFGLFQRLQTQGTQTERLAGWRDKNLLAVMFRTKSGAHYLVEPQHDEPSLVTRISEIPPYDDAIRLIGSKAIIRRQGNPDRDLQIGKCANILGLARMGSEFDPDSLYTTTNLTEISFIEDESL